MCTTVIVGRLASSTGTVLVGHNEDAGGRTFTQQFIVPGGSRAPGSRLTAEPGRASVPDVPAVLDTYWSNMLAPEPGSSFDQGMANSAGLVVCSNGGGTSFDAALSDEEAGLKDGGLGFLLRRVTAERARSAREAAELAGRLIAEYGYFGAARNYTFADAREAWVLNVVKGRRFVARRVPDDSVMLISNMLAIRAVDPSDRENVIASPDLIDHAVRTGRYVPAVPGRTDDFDFARAYQSDENRHEPGKSVRMRIGWQAITGKVYGDELHYPEVQRPSAAMTPADVMRVLRLTDPETRLTRSDGLADAFHVSARDISRSHTREGWVMQTAADPAQQLLWHCEGPVETGFFVPRFPFAGRLPPHSALTDLDEARARHFSVKPERLSFNPAFRYFLYAEIAELVNFDRSLYAGVLFEQRRLEARLETELEKLLGSLPADRETAAQQLAQFSERAQSQADALCRGILDDIRGPVCRVIGRRRTSAQGPELIEVAVFGSEAFDASRIEPESVLWSLGFTSSKASALAPAVPIDCDIRDLDGDGYDDAVFAFRAEDIDPYLIPGVRHDTYLRGFCRRRRFAAMAEFGAADV
ncbi:MAG: C69 family dipeptidase [Sutterella sp.]|nr:C69 family dipeptidase [Sutterella sp.]